MPPSCVLRFGPDDHMFRAQRNPLPATETLSDRWHTAWTGHCCTFYVVYSNGLFIHCPSLKSTRNLKKIVLSLIQQVIYPLKDIYPDSGSMSQLLPINMQTCILDIKQKHTRTHIAFWCLVCLKIIISVKLVCTHLPGCCNLFLVHLVLWVEPCWSFERPFFRGSGRRENHKFSGTRRSGEWNYLI